MKILIMKRDWLSTKWESNINENYNHIFYRSQHISQPHCKISLDPCCFLYLTIFSRLIIPGAASCRGRWMASDVYRHRRLGYNHQRWLRRSGRHEHLERQEQHRSLCRHLVDSDWTSQVPWRHPCPYYPCWLRAFSSSSASGKHRRTRLRS